MSDNKIAVRNSIDIINKTNDSLNKKTDTLYDTLKEDLASTNGVIKRKIGDYNDSIKAKLTDRTDIFEDLIKTVESFIGVNDNNINEKPAIKNKLRRYAEQSATTAIRSAKQIIVNDVSKALFAGDNTCGTNVNISIDTITLSPTEIDLLNMLKEDPSSTIGTIMYEQTEETGLVKMNRELYNLFDSGSPYDFTNYDGEKLFTINWDAVNQEYQLNGLTTVASVKQFITDYYSSIEFPDINEILNQAMLMTINGDGTESKSFDIGTDMLERLLNKLFSACGSPNNDNILNQTAVNEDDDSSYFDFNDIEGIDVFNEDLRKRKVMRFVDCNSFETQINPNNISDFAYFSGRKNPNENITNTLNKVAIEAYENSGQSIDLQNFQISITGLYVLKIPRAIISTILSPKMMFPIVTLYKVLNNVVIGVDIKEMMKTLAKLFVQIIKKIFWKFIKEFWGYVKKELLNFVKKIAMKIIKDMLKRWKAIVSSLIALLTKLLTTTIDNCSSLYKIILETIEAALNTSISIPLPGILLLMADTLPGYSSQKAYMNVVQNLTNAGIEMGELYGRPNKLNDMIKGILDGHTQEMDANSYVKITLKEAVLPSSMVSTVITPGTVMGVGKVV